MARKQKEQALVVGEWSNVGVFVPRQEQPEKPITDVAKMVAWCRANIKDAGSYDFIRRIQGQLVVAVQQQFVFEFNGGTDGD